ncbi:phosphatase PAP2 family protein [Paenibacillus sp. GCM10023252]|uniref:phosphatase PAP2 family protein n=1 Tax=Paenibacillus sp. GCM10023252 TaxID=3252649 RepID=UPI0036101E08
MSIQKNIGYGTAIASGIVFLAILFMLPDEGGTALDQYVAAKAEEMRGEGATAWWEPLTMLGSSAALIAVTILLSLVIGWLTGPRYVWPIPISMAIAYALNSGIKLIVDRPRPDGAWGISVSGASFPSGNAMLAMVLYGLCAIWIVEGLGLSRTAKWTVRVMAAIIIAAMGLSRLYFSVHYATDIIAGYAAGGVVVGAALAAAPLSKLRKRRGPS